MIDELKSEIEKTFGRKVANRGDCEALVQDIYEKTGAVLSYNTLRRIYGLAEYRKPRESTLSQLAVYSGFQSYKDFCQRFTEVDNWPSWENLYVGLSGYNAQELLDLLRFRKLRQDQFVISYTVIVRELLYRKDLQSLLFLFREPSFQFSNLAYDEVAQIGILIGLHFKTFDDFEMEKILLQEPNFRDLVFKIFVDYSSLNGKYGRWVQYLNTLQIPDEETTHFIKCIHIWRVLLTQERFPITLPAITLPGDIPKLSSDQHPILFGRVFGLHMLCAKDRKAQNKWIIRMQQRIEDQPQFITELLYEPAVQALVFNKMPLADFVYGFRKSVNEIKMWYHLSQVAVHKVFQVSVLLKQQEFNLAQQMLDHIPYDHIRRSYREFIELYVSFFRWKIANALGSKEQQELQANFIERRQKLSYPLFTDAYFETYFVD